MTYKLEELAFKYGTDKRGSRHGYVKTYEELFSPWQSIPIKLLEIGVYNCSSHNMWVDYFPNAQIYGIDINDSLFEKYKQSRLLLDKVDQGDIHALNDYALANGPWNIIIDDGSHLSSHQKLSFNVLWEYLKAGGYYVIEDTHSSYWPHLIDCEVTAMDYLLTVTKDMCEAPHYKGYYANPDVRKHHEDLNKWQREIEYMRYQMGLLIIKKRMS